MRSLMRDFVAINLNYDCVYILVCKMIFKYLVFIGVVVVKSNTKSLIPHYPENNSLSSFTPLDADDSVNQCLDENSLTVLDLYDNERKHELACFNKCLARELDFLDEDGVVNVNRVADFPDFVRMSKQQQAEYTECLEEINQITACEDVYKITNCYRKVVKTKHLI